MLCKYPGVACTYSACQIAQVFQMSQSQSVLFQGKRPPAESQMFYLGWRGLQWAHGGGPDRRFVVATGEQSLIPLPRFVTLFFHLDFSLSPLFVSFSHLASVAHRRTHVNVDCAKTHKMLIADYKMFRIRCI